MRTLPPCLGPSRRDALRFGAVSLATAGALGVRPFRLRAEAGDPRTSNLPAVIFLWLPGGPAHQDTFDMKPDAPSEYRGDFRPIDTTVPGLRICEHLPGLAKVADKFAVIRSIAHTFADHGGGHKKFLTGRDPLRPTETVNDTPMVGSMAAKLLGNRTPGVPTYVCGTDAGRAGIDTFAFGSAYLGPGAHPFTLAGDPSDPAFEVKNLAPLKMTQDSLAERVALLERFNRVPVPDASRVGEGLDAARGRALELLTGDRARHAFDLTKESPATRAMYGDHRYGQRCLLARRLVEAGSQWVTMVLENATPRGQAMATDCTYNWDSHAVNCHIFTDTKHKLAHLDKAVSALISDLYARGLDKKVLLVLTGEFGRTPKLESKDGRPGRDHWPQAQSVVVSGGGFRMGQAIGSTTAKAETPKDRPMTPNHLWATVFKHLDLDAKGTSFPDAGGRPVPVLDDGEPIRELV